MYHLTTVPVFTLVLKLGDFCLSMGQLLLKETNGLLSGRIGSRRGSLAQCWYKCPGGSDRTGQNQTGAGMDEEEQERKRKLEAGKAKLAQFRQRKGQTDGQNTAKKNKKKKSSSSSKQRDHTELVSEAGLSQSDDAPSQTAPSSGAGTTTEFTIMRTLPQGEMIQHDKTYTIEPESEVSTTADDYSSEVVDDLFPLPADSTAHILWEEEFGVRETFSERGPQSSQARLEVMEDELAGKQQEIEELNRELEEMRAAYGNEGLQQLQEFETAIKQRDGIITQLTSNLQQARKEKDDIMREFLELTEQSQKLKIQFQHLQAGETLRNSSHSSTAADLLHSRQQILSYQQQLEEREQHLSRCQKENEEREQHLSRCQKENEELRTQVTSLQDHMHRLHQEQQRELESSYEERLKEKDSVVDSLKSALHNEEIKCTELKEKIYAAEKSVDELREQLTQKSLEINSLSEELNTSKQRERRSSDEIKQLMGAVEDLQKKHHKDSQSEAELAQRMESETQRKLEQLQAELDEMYGQQIVQMKQELVRQHTLEIERLLDQHKQELDNLSRQTSITVTDQRIDELNAVINEINTKLQESEEERKKMKEDLSKKLEFASSEKSHLQKQMEDLIQDLSFAREQIQKAKQSLTEKENQLNEANTFLTTIDDLKAELVAAKEFTKELESKHEAEVTNYKIKLDMLEREKDAVLDRMAESQEAELEKLRTYFLFSQEEELTKLREELGQEHRTNIENLKDNLEIQYKNQIEKIQHDMNQTITTMQSEKDSLITKQNNLMLEISKLKDSPQCVYDARSEEMMVQINELQKELECLRREEKEKGSIEQEVQVLQLRIEVLEKEAEDKDALKEKLIVLEADNRLLRDENDALQSRTKDPNTENCEKLTELDLKKQNEELSLENERLRNLELRLKEEIELQKNTFSFAEKNFEVNYHELKDEYTFLAKEKEQLEDSKSKMEEDFRLRLQALHHELAKFKGDARGETRAGAAKSVKVHRLDVGEVVEKDTTELMEKLEIAQRDKQELSLKLSSLSEELQLKQNEINQLKEKVKSLGLERDRETMEDESCIEHKDNVPIAIYSHVLLSGDGGDTHVLEESVRPIESPHLHVSSQDSYLQKELQDLLMERESLLQRVQELTGKLEAETSLVESARREKDELQQRASAAVQEQRDLMLQLEAQRISLTQIHRAHVELIAENSRAEREQELKRLRDSLLASQEQKTRQLQELHQQESPSRPPPQPQPPPLPQTDAERETCQDLTEMLMKRIHEEWHHISQVFGERLTDEKDSTEEAEVMSNLTDSRLLEQHRTAMQTLHSNLESLLERFLKEYKQMRELSSYMEKAGDLPASEEEIPAVTPIVIHSPNPAASQSGVQEALISPPSSSSSSEVERLKAEFSQQRSQLEAKHAQEIQHLRSYFQQQLKENEERFSTEIIHLQEKLQDGTAGSLESRDRGHIEPSVELGLEEAAIFQSIVAPSSDVLKIDEAAQMGDHSLRQPFGPIYQQLQTLRQALYTKYVEEVNALKKQHEAELDQLRADLTAQHNKENDALNQEIIHLTKAKQEILNGSSQEPALYPIPEEKDPEDLNQLVEERFHEKIEEEVARVIVEMSIAFAQQSELARLAVLKDGELAESEESPGEKGEMPAEETDLDGQKLQGVMSPEGAAVTADGVSADTGQHPNDPTAEQQGGRQPVEKMVVLKEEDYNQMVAMGAESAKYKQMYEEKVEDMRQELVRQEQEYQQAAEALRLAHTGQLERQMYNQEQLLLEVHRLQAQLLEMSEIQATDREKMLLEQLETMRQTCAEATARACPMQDNSSQTPQDERPLLQPESQEPGWEYGQGDGERKEEEEEEEESPASDAGSDRKTLKRTNKHLLRILHEVVKTTGAVEETIGRHVVSLLDKSGRRQSTSKGLVWSAEPEHLDAASPAAITVTAGPGGGDAGAGIEGAGIWTTAAAAEEELDVPLQLTEEGLSGTDLSPEDEAQILNISIRLQAAVEKLLEAINDTSNQLAHAKVAQTELVRESIKRKQETSDLLRCQEELQERLNEEAKAREHLALELSKAEGLLDGYTDERVFLEKQMQEKSDVIRHLEQELQSTGNRLQELEQERQQIQEEKELLSRQKLALRAEAAPAEQQLLEETEKLLKEKIEVQRQAEKDSGDLHSHMKVLEAELEEQVNRYMELEQEKNAELEDLRQKNLSLEKQLDKTRRFLDEQAVDREHERDVFQQEIQKLEQQLKMPQRHQPVTEDQSNEVEKLESNLKEKTDKCSELLLCKEQLQRDVQERNEEMEKMEGRIRELEQALIISADGLHKVEDRRPSIVIGLKGEMPLEAQLQVEREATDRKEKEITNLVEQLEQFREELENKNEEVQQLHMQLEIQRKESDTRLQELELENKVLKDEAEGVQRRHPRPFSSSKVPQPKPGKTEEMLLLKDQEIDLLNEQIGKLQAQLESATDNKVIEEKNEQIKEYKSQIKCLKSDQEQLKKNSEEEIEKLNEVIEKLQEELSRIEQKVAVDFTDKHQYEDMADRKELVGHGEVSFTDMEEENVDANKAAVNNMAIEHMNTYNTEMGNEISSMPSKPSSDLEDVQATLTSMESKIKELMDVIKKKDEQIIMLEKQILEETVNSRAVEHENKSYTDRKEETSPMPSKPMSEPEDMQVTLTNMESKLKDLMDVIKKKDEQIVMLEKQILEERVNNRVVEHENSSNADGKEETSPMPSKPSSDQEDVHVTLTNMESKLEELMDVIKKKDEQIIMLEKQNLVVKNLEETVNNRVVEHENKSNTDRRDEVSSMPLKPMSEPEDIMESKLEELMDVIKKKDEQIIMLEKQILEETVNNTVVEHENKSDTDRRDEVSTLPSKPLSEPEDMEVTLQNMESKLKEMMDIIKKKDEQIVILEKQTLVMKDLEETVKRLQLGLEERDQKSRDQLGPVVLEKPVLSPNIEESNADGTLFDKAKNERKPLHEVVEKHLESSENLVKDGGDTVPIERLTEELREKTAQYLAMEALLVSVQEASKEAIHRLEIQLRDLQTVVHEKDSQILQLTSASTPLENQEIERLQDMIKDLQEKLADAEGMVNETTEGQRETLLENTDVLLEKVDQDDSELARIKAELERTTMEMALLEKELEKHKLLERTIKVKKDECTTMEASIGGAPVTDVELMLSTNAADRCAAMEETTDVTIKNMESWIQELQNVIDRKDAELLKYANQKDLLNWQTKEIERLNKTLEDFTKEKPQISMDSDVITKDGESQTSYREKEVEDKSALQAELEETKTAMAVLREKLDKVKDVKTKDGVSQTYHQETLMDNEENVLQKGNGKVPPIIAKLEKTRMEMEMLEEKMSKIRLFQESEDVKESDGDDKKRLQVESLQPSSKSGKTAQSQEDKVVLTFTNTTKEMESQIQQLQNLLKLKDEELLQCQNQKDLIKQQAQEIEELKAEVREERKVSADSGATTKDEESQTSQKTTTTESREVRKDSDRKDVLQAELQEAKMEVAALKEELGKLKESVKEDASSEGEVHKAKRDKRDTEEAERKRHIEPSQTTVTSKEATQNIIHNVESQDVKIEVASSKGEVHKAKRDKRDTEEAERKRQAKSSQATLTSTEETTQNIIHDVESQDVKVEEAHKAKLDKRDTEESQRDKPVEPSQATLTSTVETTQNIIHDKESRLQELQKVIQQKDSELQQYLNQQNLVSQQTMEIERLHDLIETLNQKLVEAELKKSSIAKTEGGDKEKEVRPLVNGETAVTNSHEARREAEQDSRGKDNIDGQESLQGKSTGGETHHDGVEGALRDRTAQHVANQVLLTSVQETMQNTIDAMESQLQEMQKVIKEKDSQILLYIDEIKTLKEQVKSESDQHGQIMVALEDTLREKVAAALVSDAQLKAIQVHTKEMHEDDRPAMLEEEEAGTLRDLGAAPSKEEEAEAKLSALSLRLLELEKQLSDLHEQLQAERQQVNAANQQASEKERQLHELQKVLESSWGNRDINWVKGEPDAVESCAPSQSQGIVIQPKVNTVTDLENALQSVKAEATATKEELCHYREMAEKLKEELMVKESTLAHLEEDLREVKKYLAHAEEKLAFYMKKELQEEQQQTMAAVDFPDEIRSPEWSTRERSTSSSSQTDIVPSVNNGNQTARIHHKNIGVQKEPESGRRSNASEEVAELMEHYTEKISQMQELHAAEILDMEARHISEADTLRREQYAVVQALTNECEALKVVIEALKSSGGVVPDSALSTSYHLTDAASSECDWSQGTCDAQSLDQLPEGLRVEDDIPAELLPSKIKDLLRAVHQEGMQVLSLTEATSPEKDQTFTLKTPSWREERKTLLDTIASLKDLIGKMQIYKEPEVHTRSDFHERIPDWRGELLRAIQEVFCREQDALLSAFHTQLATLSNCDPTALVNQMQHKLQEQGIEQINSMDCIQNAERRSLLLEIQDLRAQLTSLQIDRNIETLHHTEGAALYLPPDPSALPQEMHLQLNSMKVNAGELQEQLGSERLLSAEVKSELALTKMELESTLKLQHKHFKELESLRMELKKRRDELDSVNDTLANEQKKTRELQWALEREKTKTERIDQQDKEELEDLQILLEEQKTKTLEISKRLEEEQLLVKSLQEELASKESLHEAALSVQRSRVSELQAFLDAEKTHSGELANVLEHRQGLVAHLESAGATGQPEGHNPTQELLRDLQAQLESKHHRIVELVSEAEGYKLECVRLRQNLDEERQRLRKELETEKETARLAKKQVEDLTAVVEELRLQIQERVKEIRRLQAEEKRLKETIQTIQNREQTKEGGEEGAGSSETAALGISSVDPARSEVCQLVGSAPNVLCPDPLSTVNGDPDAFSIDTIRRRLLQVSSKLIQLAAKATRRAMFDAADDDDFAWSQNAIQEVMSQLEHLSVLSLQGQNLVIPPGISANTLTEKLLTQNAELTGYVSRLTNEKNDLQNALLRLEGEISHHRAREGSGDHSTWDPTMNINSFTEEREAWNREKLNLHKSLKEMEAELSKVKAELRNESIQRDLGRDTDNAALKRVYGKYLRSESFRKALVYQKKYLLLLLGGFQECEEATLALIARMGGQPSYTDLEVITKHSRAFTRFRSAARVAIAVSRMKFLVRRWQRAVSPGGVANRNGFGQNIGNEVRTDSPYHPAGGGDLYGDQRLSCRSRSGFDSPQSTVNSQHRFASSDLSPCSHLQNYDPDRALTDYIARLEALQKRLGNAPSGSNANSTTHYSIRR
ncbi:A-kinase anchor protein 9 isoform X2 [Dendropsophus ebraccatus]|uniref:A-kinase anchor protein 9 isoform X2 n=1 Tax=Dendropsophus ebraccatus TaxID=150705 RepID=UPI00383119C0